MFFLKKSHSKVILKEEIFKNRIKAFNETQLRFLHSDPRKKIFKEQHFENYYHTDKINRMIQYTDRLARKYEIFHWDIKNCPFKQKLN